MPYWNDQLKLGKGSRFIKRDLRLLPLTEVEFAAEFFLAPHNTGRQELWMGMVIARGFDDVLAMDDGQFPPPTINNLANLLAHAMLRPLTDRDRQRPRKIHLRDRPQWRELFAHLQQLGIQVVLADDLPWFDKAVLEFLQHGAARHVPRTVVDEELRLILTETDVARKKKLRPKLEAIVGLQQDVRLSIHEWGFAGIRPCVRCSGRVMLRLLARSFASPPIGGGGAPRTRLATRSVPVGLISWTKVAERCARPASLKLRIVSAELARWSA